MSLTILTGIYFAVLYNIYTSVCHTYVYCSLVFLEQINYTFIYSYYIHAHVQVTMDVSKPNPSTPSQTHILCRYFNMTGIPFSDFVFQAAVPKYMKLEMQPPSSTSLSAYSNGNVTQEIRINNTLHGEKPVMLKLKIVYKVNGQQVCTMYTMFICCVN